MLNSIVIHSKYGKGTIIDINDKYLKVSFESCVQLKTFLYPDSFEKYLIFEESILQEKAIQDFLIIKEKHEIELEQKRLEYEVYKAKQKNALRVSPKRQKKVADTTKNSSEKKKAKT